MNFDIEIIYIYFDKKIKNINTWIKMYKKTE
jgi:hypothetical protein